MKIDVILLKAIRRTQDIKVDVHQQDSDCEIISMYNKTSVYQTYFNLDVITYNYVLSMTGLCHSRKIDSLFAIRL